MMRKLILIVCCLLGAVGSAQAADATGEWLVEDGAAHIRIVNCGGALWGIVSWERSPGGRDTNNPDPALRNRPTLGMPILLGLKPTTQHNRQVWAGEVYNAKNGRTYDVTVRLEDPNTLHIEGCVLGGLFCGGQDWSRVPPSEQASAQQPRGSAKSARGNGRANEVCSRISSLSGRTH